MSRDGMNIGGLGEGITVAKIYCKALKEVKIAKVMYLCFFLLSSRLQNFNNNELLIVREKKEPKK